MSLKVKLVSTMSAFFLILGLAIMGVFAAPSATINLGGSLTFTATDVNATVTGTVKGTASAVTLEQLNFDNTTDVAKEGAKWSNKTLAFDDKGSTITIVITVTNNAKDRPLYVQVQDAVPDNSAVVDKTMKTLATVDATEGTDYDGSMLSLEENATGNTYQAFIQITLKVKDANTSLDGATYGYTIKLFNENPIKDVTKITNLAFETEDVNYTASVKMSTFEDTVGDIVIPAYIQKGGKIYTVTTVPERGFWYNDYATGARVTSVVFPDTITSIGKRAFADSWTLKSVTFGKGLKTIGTYAFANPPIESLVLPEGLETIEDGAFAGSKFTQVIIPASVTSLNAGAFMNNNNLTSITFKSATPPTITESVNGDFRTYSVTINVPAGCASAYATAWSMDVSRFTELPA